MPKLWANTLDLHRREVHDAILDTAADLVAKRGLASVTMSEIAEETGIGRATLYKYFSDVESILVAWHERHVEHHLRYLTEVRDRHGEPGQRLEAVLEAYAVISYERASRHGRPPKHGERDPDRGARDHGGMERHSAAHENGEISALVHRDEHVVRIERRLSDFLRDLLAEAAAKGRIRDDVPPGELARYCLHSLAAAAHVPSKNAARRLVTLTLAGLRPSR